MRGCHERIDFQTLCLDKSAGFCFLFGDFVIQNIKNFKEASNGTSYE